jgi:hypothetical protein
MMLPLDHPSLRSVPRLYAAITNHCNRACPWCSVYASPVRRTFLPPEALAEHFPPEGLFELQLEGGEPTTHPEFWQIVRLARAEARLTRLVLCTNGVLIPRSLPRLDEWLAALGRPLLLKLSVNHHLLAKDRGLLDLAGRLAERCDLVLNVRRRRGAPGDDAWVMEQVRAAGLAHLANDFFLQRYGLASGREEWDEPFSVRDGYIMVNPDGSRFAANLVARSEAMGALP